MRESERARANEGAKRESTRVIGEWADTPEHSGSMDGEREGGARDRERDADSESETE